MLYIIVKVSSETLSFTAHFDNYIAFSEILIKIKLRHEEFKILPERVYKEVLFPIKFYCDTFLSCLGASLPYPLMFLTLDGYFGSF